MASIRDIFKKVSKNLKKDVKISIICVFMFPVPKDIAHKMVKKTNFTGKRHQFCKPQFKTGSIKSRKKTKNAKKRNILGSKLLKINN